MLLCFCRVPAGHQTKWTVLALKSMCQQCCRWQRAQRAEGLVCIKQRSPL
jgi:hypothetical protein